jgi:hypothetical protein
MPSNLWLRPASQFHEARSLCQSRHAVKAAVITTAVPKATNNATIIATMATKVSVIEVQPFASRKITSLYLSRGLRIAASLSMTWRSSVTR